MEGQWPKGGRVPPGRGGTKAESGVVDVAEGLLFYGKSKNPLPSAPLLFNRLMSFTGELIQLELPSWAAPSLYGSPCSPVACSCRKCAQTFYGSLDGKLGTTVNDRG